MLETKSMNFRLMCHIIALFECCRFGLIDILTPRQTHDAQVFQEGSHIMTTQELVNIPPKNGHTRL
jgi:hypothetical protein